MELIIALVLFIGMVGCWVVLPGSTTTISLHQEESPAAMPQTSLTQ